VFKRVDRDGDGQISHEEWTRWQAQGFAAATESNDSRMPAADYQSMKWVEGAYARPTAGQNNQ
jgi:Ca2+-binding EF-hand superfamily protein